MLTDPAGLFPELALRGAFGLGDLHEVKAGVGFQEVSVVGFQFSAGAQLRAADGDEAAGLHVELPPPEWRIRSKMNDIFAKNNFTAIGKRGSIGAGGN